MSDSAKRLDEWAEKRGVPPVPDSICPCGVVEPTCSGTYVGPAYDASGVRILFVGLDQGQGVKWSPLQTLRWYREDRKPWNLHYIGCIRVAAEILNLGCESECQKRCSVLPEKECALCQFAQGNAVRCVEAHKKSMESRSQERIRQCLPLLFEQIEILRPTVIVLQGRNRSGHIHEDFKKELRDGAWGSLEMAEGEIVGRVAWHRFGTFTGRTVIAFFRHPSALGHHSFAKNWSSETVPAIQGIRQLLALK